MSGKKEYTPPPWHPSSLGRSPESEVIEQNTMVHTISLGKQGKRVYTIGPARRVYSTEASGPRARNKEGFHGGGVYFSLPNVHDV